MENLLLIGDSHLARTKEDAGVVLAQLINESLPELKVTNWAKGGINTYAALEIIKSGSWPEVFGAVVLLGTNDAASWKQVPVDEYRENYRQIIGEVKARTGDLIVVTPPPVDETKQDAQTRSNETLGLYAQQVRELAQEGGIKCLDLFDILKTEMKKTDVFDEDGVHLNASGYAIFWSLLQREIGKWM